ncbi:major histocompatibility complex class I UBA precursor [Danio rerio]|uniref:Major histocompatibility complex class I UBA precursor n=1 Tax=Danio rerio TaxID=7955 RepID=Q31365_DANRE|nr:major histocompatibility complex class I UBA precursor [Danio rerio]CAA86732.1 UBA*01 [Danio rerio]|eukprot:NP_571546.1 major histocompatibility complex class I UBA precursor [Danio rerio]
MQSLIGLLLVVCLQYASGATHSWKAYYTGTTGLTEFPEFVALNLIDDQLMGYFDSKTNRFKSQFQWMEDNLGKEYDEQQTNILLGYPEVFKNNIKVVMERFNQTQGVHTFQFMYGCEMDDDGNKQVHWQIGYDGEDFISLDKKTLTWTAANSQAMTTKVKWDSTGAEANYWKGYLENECIEWVQKYVGYGKDTLERKVSPQVSLLQKSSSSPVVCHVTGFYPSGLKISWQRNGQDHDEDVELGELIPNEDGTYQRTSTLNVKPEEWKKDKFSCVVEHQSKTINSILTEDEIRTNNPTALLGIIIGIVVAAVLLVAIAVAGFVVYRRHKGFKPVPQNTSDGGSDNSSRT